MTRKRLIEDETIDSSSRDTSTWPMVNWEALNSKDKAQFLKRKRAVDLYMKNELTVKDIAKDSGLHRTEIRRLVKRCLAQDDNGVIWGYRALISHKHLKYYERTDMTKTRSLAGAFNKFLEQYPLIRKEIDSLFLKRKRKVVTENVITPKYIHKQFLRACRNQGLTVNDYPLNTKTLGQRSLYRYLDILKASNVSEAAKRYGDDTARLIRTTGRGEQNVPMVVRPFQKVQFDGHCIDASLSLSFLTPEGDEVVKVMDRLWLLVIIDVATRAILGYYLSFNKEYTAYDVLQCIKNAVVPWEEKKFTIPGLSYPHIGGFASNVIPETKWGLWEEFWYDNAKANLANVVRERLTHLVQCSINAGPVNMPERRSIVERFFLTLEENGYHRLPSTTGRNPDDPRRQDPEKKAVDYRITANHLEELTEVLIASYNGTPHEGVNNLTPLEAMKQRIEVRGMSVRQLDYEKRSELAFLSLEAHRTIKGNISSGKRPYIQYENVVYRSEVLSRSNSLVGTKLTIFVNTDDLRVVKAFLPDGSEFGYLTATGKWGVTPHTLQDRKAIFNLKTRKLLHFSNIDDPIHIYHSYLRNQAINSKRGRNKLAEYQRKQKIADTASFSGNNSKIASDSFSSPHSTPINKSQSDVASTSTPPRLRKTITY